MKEEEDNEVNTSDKLVQVEIDLSLLNSVHTAQNIIPEESCTGKIYEIIHYSFNETDYVSDLSKKLYNHLLSVETISCDYRSYLFNFKVCQIDLKQRKNEKDINIRNRSYSSALDRWIKMKSASIKLKSENIMESLKQNNYTLIRDELKFFDIINMRGSIIDIHNNFTKMKLYLVPIKHLNQDSYNEIKQSSQDIRKTHSLRKNQSAYSSTNFLDFEISISTDDLSALNISKNDLLLKLEQRFTNKRIYTYIGPFLISINPYHYYPIYNPRFCNRYSLPKTKVLPPHIFSVAEQVHTKLFCTYKKQCIIVNGISGSGKTESVKFLIRQLLYLSFRGALSSIELMLNASIQIFEAFGNAVTESNANSSRFGCFIQMNYRRNGALVGAKISHYLLETSRITNQGKNDSNYHIFYYFLSDTTDIFTKKYKILKNKADYNYISNRYSDSVSLIENDMNELNRLIRCFKAIDINDDVSNDIFNILSAILHIGNIEITEKAGEKCDIKDNDYSLIAVAELLSFNVFDIKSMLLKREKQVGSEFVVVNYNREKSDSLRNSFSASLYSHLFKWLIGTSNAKLSEDLVAGHRSKLSICLLDLFGFENFSHNSFEQFCINFANEKLHNFIFHHVFQNEQSEYISEGMDIEEIDFSENQDSIRLICGKPISLIDIINEECELGSSSPETMFEKIKLLEDNPSISFNTLVLHGFTISHYGGQVTYSLQNFKAKNLDKMGYDIVSVIKKSGNKLISEIFGKKSLFAFWRKLVIFGCAIYRFSIPIRSTSNNDLTSKKMSQLKRCHAKLPKTKSLKGSGTWSARKLKYHSVLYKFQLSLNDLMKKLNESECSFVFCLSSNDLNKASQFSQNFVYYQLENCGILNGLKLLNNMYNFKYPIPDFMKRFSYIMSSHSLGLSDKNALSQYSSDPGLYNTEHIKLIMSKLRLSDNEYFVGKSKVFLKEKTNDYLATKNNSKFVDIVHNIEAWAVSSITFKRFKLLKKLSFLKEYIKTCIIFSHYNNEQKNNNFFPHLLSETRSTIYSETGNIPQNNRNRISTRIKSFSINQTTHIPDIIGRGDYSRNYISFVSDLNEESVDFAKGNTSYRLEDSKPDDDNIERISRDEKKDNTLSLKQFKTDETGHGIQFGNTSSLKTEDIILRCSSTNQNFKESIGIRTASTVESTNKSTPVHEPTKKIRLKKYLNILPTSSKVKKYDQLNDSESVVDENTLQSKPKTLHKSKTKNFKAKHSSIRSISLHPENVPSELRNLSKADKQNNEKSNQNKYYTISKMGKGSNHHHKLKKINIFKSGKLGNNLSNSSTFPGASDNILISNLETFYIFINYVQKYAFANHDDNASADKELVVFYDALQKYANFYNAVFMTSFRFNEKVSISESELLKLFVKTLDEIIKSRNSTFPVALGKNSFEGLLSSYKTANKHDISKMKKGYKKLKSAFNMNKMNVTNNGHSMSEIEVNGTVYCEVCNVIIWEPSAFLCQECNFTCHKKCVTKIETNCKAFYKEESSDKFFGIEISALVTAEHPIPFKLSVLLQEIEKRGLKFEGIYRKSHKLAEINEVKAILNSEDFKNFNLADASITLLSSLIKLFFRSLPSPLIPKIFTYDITRAAETASDDLIIRLNQLIDQFPVSNRTVLDRIITHLASVALCESSNLMNSNNLATIFTPCFFDLSCTPNYDQLISIKYQTSIIDTLVSHKMKEVCNNSELIMNGDDSDVENLITTM